MLKGEEKLTKREKEILEYLEKGCTNKEIASQLGITYGTAMWHCKRIIGKLGVKNRKEIKKLKKEALL